MCLKNIFSFNILYDRITIPTILIRLEEVRKTCILKTLTFGNPIILDTIRIDAFYITPARYIYTPLEHFLTLYSDTLEPTDPARPYFAIHESPHLSPHVYSSQHM